MKTKTLTPNTISLMDYLMHNETIANKVYAAGKKGKRYVTHYISDDGTVVLGETKHRFWNQLIGCKFTLTFESFASCVWDALIDLSTGDNQEALLKGLSKEVLEKAQREKEYDFIIERLVDCYRHFCNNKEAESRSEDRPGKSGQKIGSNVIVEKEPSPVEINVNVGNRKRSFHFPDATGKADLVLEMGVVGVSCEQH